RYPRTIRNKIKNPAIKKQHPKNRRPDGEARTELPREEKGVKAQEWPSVLQAHKTES
ncbi:hypothetical protein SK128_000010, partial [Halocaridina rubra]